ncbi:MAG: hypothetical protein KGD57_08045 [Candidatus Lokiarchaeota archaeon]|nr:hypothetical protein [Candidatus Lokiarchaeota archaeon]
MAIRKIFSLFKKKVKEFFFDKYGGNLVEYALLIGFALFVFFIIFSIISSIMDWTIGLSDDFFGLLK